MRRSKMPLFKLPITSHSWLSTAERKTTDRGHCLVTFKQFQIIMTHLWTFFGNFINFTRKHSLGMVTILRYSELYELPSSKNPHFQSEAKCTTFLVKMSLICMRMKNHLHIKGWVLHWSNGVSNVQTFITLEFSFDPECMETRWSESCLLIGCLPHWCR